MEDTNTRQFLASEQDPPAASSEDLEPVAEHGVLKIKLIEAAADKQAQ